MKNRTYQNTHLKRFAEAEPDRRSRINPLKFRLDAQAPDAQAPDSQFCLIERSPII
jgi:hypothetical protein